jgi:hypothetical protein
MSSNRSTSLNYGDRAFQRVDAIGFDRPRGDITTVLDLTDRDDQDDTLFPLDTQVTRWTRTGLTRYIPFTQSDLEYNHTGPAEFGERFTFELGKGMGDFLGGLSLQIRLGHWFPENVLQGLTANQTTYGNSTDPWFYANSLGTVLIKRAELEVDGQVVEVIDGDFLNIWTLLNSSSNGNFGISSDALGRLPVGALRRWPSYLSFPTDNRTIICPLLFHFGRLPMDEAFPLVAARDGTVRVNIELRPFSEVVRIASGVRPGGCEDTPLQKSFSMLVDNSGGKSPTSPLAVVTGVAEPAFEDVRLITRSVFIDGPLRDLYMKKPFEYLYRQVQTFVFDEPLKYVTAKSTGLTDSVEIQLPLELNHPVEELIWVVRRKGVILNNEWTNYTTLLESQRAAIDPISAPSDPSLSTPAFVLRGKIQINGLDLIEADGDFFRREIARVHRGGLTPYLAGIYGYSFARAPSKHQPSGWMNASRTWTTRITLQVVSPPAVAVPGGFDQTIANTWEVRVYAVAMNWMRFENGIANRIFTD